MSSVGVMKMPLGTDILSFESIFMMIRILIDVSLVWLVFYCLIQLVRRNIRTLQIFKGILAVLLIKLATSLFGLTTMNYLVDSVINWGIVAIMIIFQPEIRAALEKIGQVKVENPLKSLTRNEKEAVINEIVMAVVDLSKSQTGALITIEQSQSLADYIATGVRINADVKSELFSTIFWEGTPLHDGAIIIQGNKVTCAAAFYPPTNKELSPIYGARHRAAIGISEVSDSLTIVVSEETGAISFARHGDLRKIPARLLKSELMNEIDWFENADKGGDQDE